MIPEGRKIDKIYENPIDNILIDLAHWMNINLFRTLHFTPNILTTISLLFGIMAPYFYYKKRYALSSLCFMLAHLFDCADGDYARTFNMVTVFGDYYDHIGDITKVVLLIYVILIHKIDITLKIGFIVTFITLGFMSCVHLGCQERIYDPDADDFLSNLKPLCKDKKNIVWSRYFGVGTNILFVSLFLFFARQNSKR
jgi:phosphatidylglycerophosphate synthase